MMRLRLILGLGLTAGLAWLSMAARAQGDGTSASSPRSAALRRYNMRDPRLVREEPYAPYSRSTPSQAPVAPSRPNARHNYYPSARSGNAVNHNVVNPVTLCNPARRALLMR